MNVPFADEIQLPKTPKRRKIIIKKQDIQRLIGKVERLNVESMRLRTKAVILLAATSGLRSTEIYRLTLNDIDLNNRIVFVRAEKTKDYEDRITFFNDEAQKTLIEFFKSYKPKSQYPFSESTLRKAFKKIEDPLRLKHMRKFFIQEWERRGGSIAIRKMLAGGSVEDQNNMDPKRLLTGHNSVEVELQSYNFQDVEDLRRIYDMVGIRIFD
ncbi:site-specific integrase [Archaeoglobales archaeon]|nr:MAG: site-specific integrase [Archaeoglobales archaeon]